jgi:hypothetical protein
MCSALQERAACTLSSLLEQLPCSNALFVFHCPDNMHFQNTLHSPIVAETDQCIQPALHTGQPFTQDIIAYCADNMRPEKRNALPKHAVHTLTYSFIVAKTALHSTCPSQDSPSHRTLHAAAQTTCDQKNATHSQNTLFTPSRTLSCCVAKTALHSTCPSHRTSHNLLRRQHAIKKSPRTPKTRCSHPHVLFHCCQNSSAI